MLEKENQISAAGNRNPQGIGDQHRFTLPGKTILLIYIVILDFGLLVFVPSIGPGWVVLPIIDSKRAAPSAPKPFHF
jgi:hypothetical protein